MVKKSQNQKVAQQVTSSSRKPSTSEPSKDLLASMDSFLDKRLGWLTWVVMGLTLFVSLLLFDSRVSLSGDDSFYIIRAFDFIHSFKYPAFQGPLYPMVLSIFVAMFGISLVPLKLVSLVSMLGFIYLFFISFKNRIPSTLLIITILSVSLNSFILYYANQTYNEAFYLLVQMILVWVFFRSFIDSEMEVTLKNDFTRHILLALSLLALVLTKNAGYSAVFAITGYFLLYGQWKNFAYSILAFGIVMLVFQGLKYFLWSDGGFQFSTQGSGLLNKDYYNPQAGKEDLAGFFNRLIINSQLYLSKHFCSIIGLRKASIETTINPLTTILIYLMSVGSLIFTFRKNKYLFFTGLLAGSFLLVSFFILQTKWDQSRLIIPVVPMLLLILYAFMYYVSRINRFKLLQVSIPFLSLIIILLSLASTAVAVKENSKASGRYGGFTPDWKNYLKASEWASENLPKDAIIACRKPSISFVYGNGRNFYGIMQLPTYSNDLFIKNWSKDESANMLFNYADFIGKQLTPELYSIIKENMQAMVFIGDSVYFLDKVNDSIKDDFKQKVSAQGFSFTSSVNTFNSKLSGGKELKIYYPDSLLIQLQKAGVTHILTANLRRNSAVKDGMIINTVERYMAFIQEKYPQIFTKVSQAGDDDNEPATIFKIEYEKYGVISKSSEIAK